MTPMADEAFPFIIITFAQSETACKANLEKKLKPSCVKSTTEGGR